MKNVAGIILAGGKSTRMKQDKSFILLSGRPMLEIVIDKLSSVFKDLLVISNKPSLDPLQNFIRDGLHKRYNIRIYTDILPDRGPLGGIYTGLLFSNKMYNFIVGCDMPFINERLVKYMIKNIKNFDIFIPKIAHKFHPLCGIYSKNCIPIIEDSLMQDRLKVSDIFSKSKVKFISEKKLQSFDKDLLCIENINTPEDSRKICLLAETLADFPQTPTNMGKLS